MSQIPSSGTAAPIIAFRDVSVVFGRNPARALPLIDRRADRAAIRKETGLMLGVADATLDVHPGEIAVLMGLSGSGKSTLLRTVNGLAPVVRGSVSIDTGRGPVDPAACGSVRLRELRRREVAMVFQQFALLPWRSVADNVGFGLEVSGVPATERRARVEAQLALVGLADWANSRVGELSGGMQQRVGLARAFATDAPILLMDEPFSALDPLIRTRLQDELLEFQSRLKKTIVFVSHDLDEAFKLGSTIAIMEGGRIVQAGRPKDIVLAPANDYVADFVAHINPLSVLTAGDVMRPIERETGAGATIAGMAEPDAPLRRVIETLGANEGEIAVSTKGRILGRIGARDVMAALARRARPGG